MGLKKRKGGKGRRPQRRFDDDDQGGAAVASAVDLDVAAEKERFALAKEAAAAAEAEAAAAAEETAADGGEGDQTVEEKPAKDDPYLMADAKYIEKDTRWRNKQRTLVFSSRGVTSRFRHLVDDIKKLLPHHKSEPKFEKRGKLQEINEVCELKSCNNVLYFEARKMTDLYLWLGRVPAGPTFKFQVMNIHTSGEVKLAGNCLLGSRPILYFDKHFSEHSYLKLVKELFTQALGTPRNHPKCKPFHDHMMCFYWLDHKIWFRHYQITPEVPEAINEPERQELTEIGPRFVLDPIRTLGGSFCGQTLHSNAFYLSPTALRIQARNTLKSTYKRMLENKEERKEKQKRLRLPEDPLDQVFV